MTPPRPVLRAFWAFHERLYRLSGGRLGTRTPRGRRLGTLFLLTRGRRSGKERRNGLYYLEDAGAVVVVASKAGAGRKGLAAGSTRRAGPGSRARRRNGAELRGGRVVQAVPDVLEMDRAVTHLHIMANPAT